tara:strand:+ start:102 stop:263 length:162 start_codon:yes stop_codon:yes gene_type:complete
MVDNTPAQVTTQEMEDQVAAEEIPVPILVLLVQVEQEIILLLVQFKEQMEEME